MHPFADQLPRIVLLVLLAAGLGVAILHVDGSRRDGLVTSASAAQSPAAGPAATRVSVPAASPAELVGNSAVAAGVPGSSDATVPDTIVVDTPVPVDPVVTPVRRLRGGVSCEEPHRLVQVDFNTPIHASPAGRALATLPATSAYLGQAMTVWVQAVSADGRWGRVTVPWTKPVGQAGWIPIDGLVGRTTPTMVVADLSERRVHVYHGCREVLTARTAIGRAGSPSPTGRFWVTDRVRVPGAQRAAFGSYAFGLSTIQPNLPPGWTGGDQMAIHGTGAPGSIGEAASAGCLRVGEETLAKLKPLLRVGTPVIIQD